MGSIAYDKAHTKQIMFKFNLKTDADILSYLERIGNKQGYIKALIRLDMAHNATPRNHFDGSNAPESFVNTKEDPQ